VATFGDGEQKDLPIPRLSVSVVTSTLENVRPTYDLSEETVIKAIENDIDSFNESFSMDFGNEELTASERMILKAYLWWRTKRYFSQYSQEHSGMSIDGSGTVRLTCSDIRISFNISENGDELHRVWDNTIQLSARGKADHDLLVRGWQEWKRKSSMVMEGTKVLERQMSFGASQITMHRRYCGDIIEKIQAEGK